jgi:hypothetical protein
MSIFARREPSLEYTLNVNFGSKVKEMCCIRVTIYEFIVTAHR